MSPPGKESWAGPNEGIGAMVQDIAAVGSNFQMLATFAIILGALVMYAMERVPMEITSLGVVCALLIFFHFFPVLDAQGASLLSPGRLLHGFANPALITVLALLVMGQAMVRTGILDLGARWLLGHTGHWPWLSLAIVLAVVIAVSAFLNNIPVVVIFIPIMQALATRFGRSVSMVMIPLSYAAVFGGMTTLIGSGTNLLVNSALIEVGETPFTFFEFSIPGIVLATAGLIYVLLAAPKLLPERSGLVDSLLEGDGKQFIGQITVTRDSDLIGKDAPGGLFAGLPDMTVRMIQRGETAILPPFEDYRARPRDVLVVAATRKAFTEALTQDPGLLDPDLEDGRAQTEDEYRPWHEGERMLAELMVAPASRLIGRTLPQIGFRYHTHCIVLGVQRRSRMIRARLTDIRLQAGDVLLVQGQPGDIDSLKVSGDVVLIEWSTKELPSLFHARRACIIFLGAIGLAAIGVLPVVVATLSGAAIMVLAGVLNVRQAFRAVDPLVATTIVAALALGVALQETGGAAYIAHAVVRSLEGASVPTMLSIFFLLVAVTANIISTKTCAVLFTPIAVDIAVEIGASPSMFALAVVFAANCSFASPLGYQTNLLVMAPGHYRFLDYTRVGVPLIFVMWATFSLFVPWYYGL